MDVTFAKNFRAAILPACCGGRTPGPAAAPGCSNPFRFCYSAGYSAGETPDSFTPETKFCSLMYFINGPEGVAA